MGDYQQARGYDVMSFTSDNSAASLTTSGTPILGQPVAVDNDPHSKMLTFDMVQKRLYANGRGGQPTGSDDKFTAFDNDPKSKTLTYDMVEKRLNAEANERRRISNERLALRNAVRRNVSAKKGTTGPTLSLTMTTPYISFGYSFCDSERSTGGCGEGYGGGCSGNSGDCGGGGSCGDSGGCGGGE